MSGVWSGLAAYAAWGLLPVYWKQIESIPATELIAHRIAWSFISLAAILSASHQWTPFQRALRDPTVLKIYAAAALLITINWLVYVWGVNHGFIVETSLGYFINPLVSVVFGVVLFSERLRPLQWLAVALATAGVIYLTVAYGALPWISLVLALSFGCYGVVKKKAPLGSMHGLAVETALLVVPAVVYLLYVDRSGQGAFRRHGVAIDALLAGTGFVTTIPLVLFASAVQRTRLSTMGVMQYLAPTLQLLLGVLVYHEPFTRTQFGGFAIVWAGLLVFGADGLFDRRATTLSAGQ